MKFEYVMEIEGNKTRGHFLLDFYCTIIYNLWVQECACIFHVNHKNIDKFNRNLMGEVSNEVSNEQTS